MTHLNMIMCVAGGDDQLDDEQPVTALQFRLHDGSRAQASFNHSHTVGDVRQYLDNITR
jgi:UBX domain-containing protein 1